MAEHEIVRNARQMFTSLRITLGLICTAMIAPSCQSSKPPSEMLGGETSPNVATEASGTSDPQGADRAEDRRRVIDEQLRRRDITNARVLTAMERVPRHLFVPEGHRHAAYEDHPLPIGDGQTISQPYIVALMTQLAEPSPKTRALDIGTGSGYQAAILAELSEQVYSIEIIESLANDARGRLAKLGYHNVEVRHGDGYRGWPEHAPFDVIIVAAAPAQIPQPLIDQLAPNGRLVIPVGSSRQELLIVTKTSSGEVLKRKVAAVAFVPMTGAAEKK